MKKFVILMITLLVLFVFLMLNYLLWDKENLQKQSASDKVAQDYLRGKNNELQTTVDEQEQTIAALKQQSNADKSKISEQELKLRQSAAVESSLNNQILVKDNAVAEYKMFMNDVLRSLTQKWFEDISSQKYDESYELLATNFQIFGGHFEKDAYVKYIAAVSGISIVEQNEEQAKADPAFAIQKDRGDELVVIAVVTVNVKINPEQQDTYKDLSEGVNRVEIGYRYNSDNQKWAIMSVMEVNDLKP